MDDPFKIYDWRRVDALERKTITTYASEMFREKANGGLITIALFLPAVLLISFAVGASKVRGVRQIGPGIVTGTVMIGILVILYLVRRIFLNKKMNRILSSAYLVMETTVIDKEHISRGRGMGSGFYFEVDAFDEYNDRRRLMVSEPVYRDTPAGGEILLIKYDGNEYGFCDWFDCVPRKAHF